MTDLHDYDQKLVISDFINNAINTLADAISFLAGQLLAAGSTRVLHQRIEACLIWLMTRFGRPFEKTRKIWPRSMSVKTKPQFPMRNC